MITSRKEDALKRAQKEIKEGCGANVLYHCADVTKEDQVESLLKDTVSKMGTVDILVNSQGYNKKFPGTEFPLDEWENLLDVNVTSLMLTITYTPMMVGMLPDDEAERNAIAKAMPAKRIGYPEDIKGTAIFLASKASDFVTGSSIYPDGGLHICG